MIRVFCDKCGNVHQFTGLEAEKIIYTLQGMEICAQSSAPVETNEEPLCLKIVLDLAMDSEGFSEWTEGHLDSRRAQEYPTR